MGVLGLSVEADGLGHVLILHNYTLDIVLLLIAGADKSATDSYKPWLSSSTSCQFPDFDLKFDILGKCLAISLC
jgi:hypothetical protein